MLGPAAFSFEAVKLRTAQVALERARDALRSDDPCLVAGRLVDAVGALGAARSSARSHQRTTQPTSHAIDIIRTAASDLATTFRDRSPTSIAAFESSLSDAQTAIRTLRSDQHAIDRTEQYPFAPDNLDVPDVDGATHAPATTHAAFTWMASGAPRANAKAREIRTARTGDHPDEPAARRSVRDALQRIFDPLARDVVAHARALRDQPVETLALSGSAPRRDASSMVGAREYWGVEPEAVRAADGFLITDMPRSIALRIPVGEHGTQLATAIVQAARALDARVVERMSGTADAVGVLNEDLLTLWTYNRDHVIGALREGILSHAQATALGTISRNGDETAHQALDRLLASRQVDAMAKAPIGVLAPLANHGLRPTEPDGFRRIAAATRAKYQRVVAPSPHTAAGCPIAVRNPEYGTTGIHALESEFVALTKRYLDTSPTSAAPRSSSVD